MSNDIKAPTTPLRRKTLWRRHPVALVLLTVAVWWVGIRIHYYIWVTTFGGAVSASRDFSLIARVRPPADARLVAVYRGLPHQRDERSRLFRELFTTSHRALGGRRFYSSPLTVSNDLNARLQAVLQDPALYNEFIYKKCGGYHPDYCFEWESKEGQFHALLCLGCHEFILIGRSAELHCDLGGAPGKDLLGMVNELKKSNF